MRKELIERLRAYASTSLAPALMAQAADMLEADAPAATQEPVAWYEYNADLDAWFLAYGHNPKAKTRPLVFGDAAPQPRQRLTDEEILNIHALPCWVRMQFADKGYGIALDTATVVDFARAIEKKVRGEA